ncbi:MAG: FAD-dependent oxidoreductase [Gallionella sp.]|jgi:rubredoxin-NAD+ reductase|nr:FAD-dependent oxidoreductase [Gallionella sp.]
MKPIVVLGSGLAAYTLVRELRKLDAQRPVTLLTRDSGDYYSKPMLSNGLAQQKTAAGLVLTPAAEIAAQLGLKLHAHCEVNAINLAAHTINTTVGTIEYEKLVLAIGADPIRIPLEGEASDRVLSVNGLDDYARFREALTEARSVAIMGGGLIGCEFANDLAAAGYRVDVIDPGPYPLASLMPEAAGRQLLEPLAALGVNWHFGTSIKSMNSAPDGYQLALNDGAALQTNLVLSAVGLKPRIGLAQQAGLLTGRGIAVDSLLRSSDPDIFALGDCAEINGRVMPYVLPLMQSARALAHTLAGKETPVDFPVMPVAVKTPAHPIAIVPVARDAVGEWHTLDTGDGVKMGFFDGANVLQGFVLTGRFAGERNALAKQVGHLLKA